jgi:hypothetical protein
MDENGLKNMVHRCLSYASLIYQTLLVTDQSFRAYWDGKDKKIV